MRQSLAIQDEERSGSCNKEDIDDIHTQRFFGVKIPCNLTEISRYAFRNCNQLVLVSIEGSVKHIGAFAFAAWTYLTSISMGESVTHIGDGSFAHCTSLISITIGESATQIGAEAFAYLTGISTLVVSNLCVCVYFHQNWEDHLL